MAPKSVSTPEVYAGTISRVSETHGLYLACNGEKFRIDKACRVAFRLERFSRKRMRDSRPRQPGLEISRAKAIVRFPGSSPNNSQNLLLTRIENVGILEVCYRISGEQNSCSNGGFLLRLLEFRIDEPMPPTSETKPLRQPALASHGLASADFGEHLKPECARR
jgi:hypothetical protein